MSPTVHANCVVVGERGVLIRGPSGAGKSSFSAALIDRARAAGRFARLVSDDRTRLAVRHGRLIAGCPREIEGLIERRGLGITAEPWLREAMVGLVVDLVVAPERTPSPETLACEVDGVALPRLALDPRRPDAADLALKSLDLGCKPRHCDRFALAFAPQHEKIASSAS